MCKTYYVNPKIGDDENDGLHEDRAFATLFAINRLNLQPGDSVLLMRDCIFEKQFLQIRSSGTECCPITIGAYGEGNDPLIAADGQGIWYQDYGRELDSPTHVYHGYVFRHNVSYDDLGGTISPASNPDARLEQNIFYVRDGVPFVRNHMDGGNYTESNDRIIPIEK